LPPALSLSAGTQEDESRPANTLAPPVARKRDIKQFRQACWDVGLTARERYEAREALHAEKQASGKKEHMSYEQLLAWLREWKQR
jgi:hypothetical protein